MTSEEARWHVVSAFRTLGMATYEGRIRPSSLPDVVVMDPDTGAVAAIRVMTGKRPRGARRLTFDRRRVGQHAQALALVDPESGSVDLRPLPGGPVLRGLPTLERAPDGRYRAVAGGRA